MMGFQDLLKIRPSSLFILLVCRSSSMGVKFMVAVSIWNYLLSKLKITYTSTMQTHQVFSVSLTPTFD